MAAILFALTSHDQLGDTGRTTGFYVPEAAHPHQILTAAGHQVDFVSAFSGPYPMEVLCRPASRLPLPPALWKLPMMPLALPVH